MSKSNKIIISLAVAAFLIISLIVGLVVVFAEETESVKRNVNAVYRVIDADCSVSVDYTYGDKVSNVYLGSSSFTTEGIEESSNILTFVKDENNLQEKVLMPTADMVLDKTNNSIIFEFNIANTGDNLVNASLLLKNNKSKNVTIEFSLDANDCNTYDAKSENFYEKFPRLSIAGKTGSEAQSTTFFVKVSMLDVNKSSSFSADFEWTINGEF